MKKEVLRAIEAAGSQAALAHLLRVHQKTVGVWEKQGYMPATPARLAEIELKGAVSEDALTAKERVG